LIIHLFSVTVDMCPDTPAPASATAGDASALAMLNYSHWFTQFWMIARPATSAHTMKATPRLHRDRNARDRRQPRTLAVADITKDSMRQHSPPTRVITKPHRSGAAGPPGTCCARSFTPASTRRQPHATRRPPETCQAPPRPSPAQAVHALLETVADDHDSQTPNRVG